MLSAILSKLNELPDGKDVEDKEEQKKKMAEIFEKRGVGKPRGTFEEKQKQPSIHNNNTQTNIPSHRVEDGQGHCSRQAKLAQWQNQNALPKIMRQLHE